MMDCKEFREALDLFVDGELSADSLASASAHLQECAACQTATEALQRLRQGVRTAVRQHVPPPELVQRVEHRFGASRRAMPAAVLAALVVLSLALALGAVATWPDPRSGLAETLERAAARLDTPRRLVLEGEIVCRDCELKRIYGAKTMCELKGHPGALRTDDGKIWTFMEGESSGALVDDTSLHGRRVRIHGRLYRRAGCLDVERYQLL